MHPFQNFKKLVKSTTLSPKLFLYFLTPLNFTLFSIIIYIANKGIDLTDEGLHLMYANPDQNFNSPVNYNLLFKPFYFLFGVKLSIFSLRIIRLILLTISVLQLFLTISKLFFDKKLNTVFNLSLVGLAIFPSYLFGPQTLSYNSITLIFSTFIATQLIKLTFAPKNKWLIIKISCLIFIVYITKFTTAFLLIGISITVLFYRYWYSKNKDYIKSILYLGTITLLVFSIVGYLIPETSLTILIEHIKRPRGNNYALSSILLSLSISFLKTAPFIIIGYFAGKTLNSKSPYKVFLYSSITIFTFIILYVWNWSYGNEIINLPMFSSYFVGTVFCNSRLKFNNQKFIILFILLAFPFAIYFGTNNSPLIYSNMLLSFIIILVIIFESRVFKNGVVLFLFCGLFSYQFLNSTVRSPRRQLPITTCSEVIEFNNEKHYIPPQVKKYLLDLERVFKKTEIETNYVFGASRLLGEIVLLGKQFPSSPIWSLNDLNDWLMNNKLPNSFYLISNHPNSNYIFDNFKDYKITYLDSVKKQKYNGNTEIIRCYVLNK